MATVTDYLIKIQDLTKQNLDILKTLNESFFTNKSHINTNIAGVNYSIPSFLSLENKVNALRDDFENLVNAPKTGEAHFTFDGSSRVIELRGYTNTPAAINLPEVNEFDMESNNIFKDFLNPVPYINFSLSDVPNDIVTVDIKKVIPKNTELLEKLIDIIGEKTSISYSWADLYKILSMYNKDNGDYVEYDTIQRLPVRKTIGTATYVVESIVRDEIDENLDEYITLKLRSDIDGYTKNLTYKIFDDTIDKYLSVGDQLVTYDDSAKMEIVEIQSNTNTLKVKVLNGEYLNLLPTRDVIDGTNEVFDNSKLKFFSTIESDNDKYIHVPLEEDQYVFVAIAPLNDRMNIRAPWGDGLIINTSKLLRGDEKFSDYYDQNVRNIGDILSDMTSMMSVPLSNYTEDEFNEITGYKPVIDTNNIAVVQINSHLNDTDNVKNIRSLYAQKNVIKTQLDEILSKISNINTKLNQMSFDDTTGLRSTYSNQLVEYNQTRNELNTSLNKIINEIAVNANNSDIPIENAKYRIRGFYDVPSGMNIKGIKVQYRYKNLNNTSGKAATIGDRFLFSDWNDMEGFLNPKIVVFEKGQYKFKQQDSTDGLNVPSYNQIDIPISQGETVDIRLKLVYEYGYPFVEVTSDWSDIVNITFPVEYLKDVQILDIISENNNDIETNRFENIISDKGITSHVDDKIIDQDITYYHNPSHIASGFYTTERRIIPLKDKLEELTNIVTQLQDEITGNASTALNVTISIGDTTSKEILPLQNNFIYPRSYNEIIGYGDNHVAGYSVDEKGIVTTILNINIKNTSSHTLKLYPLFPGPSDTLINKLTSTAYSKDIYCTDTNKGVYMKLQNGDKNSGILQTANQFLTFCIKSRYSGEDYYVIKDSSGKIESDFTTGLPELKNKGSVLYPYIAEKTSLCLDGGFNKVTYKLINPGESVIIPMEAQYNLSDEGSTGTAESSNTISFDVRTSLYQEPTNYKFTVVFKKDSSTLDSVSGSYGSAYNVTL